MTTDQKKSELKETVYAAFLVGLVSFVFWVSQYIL